MKDRVSTYTLIGIPEAFVVILLIAGLILALAPWLPAGADFGVFKVPPLPYGSGLQIIGPVVFFVLLLLAFPIWSEGDLRLVSSRFEEQNGEESIVIEVLNSSRSTAYIHKAKIFVEGIYAFLPSTTLTAYVFSSHIYGVSLSIKDFPYEIELSLSQKVESQDADKFEISVSQDFSFFDKLTTIYGTIWDKLIEKTCGGFTLSKEDLNAAISEFKGKLGEEEKSLLKKLNIISMDPGMYYVCDIVTHFRLDLVYNINNNKHVLKTGEYLYMARKNAGSEYLQILDHTKALYDKLVARDTVRNRLADRVFTEIRSVLEDDNL
ncbi:MAG: hypothetical protein KAW47_03110 [Thermoplasmatales archaeon]|nr:hypothetical protein [Thermoplasmatales archaeon]